MAEAPANGRPTRTITRTLLLALGASMMLVTAPSLAPAAKADAIEDFYRGKTVRIIVGFAPGAGYDLYGRLAAEFLGRFIPGHPTVIVENMPGAGGRRAAQYLYSAAPQDGTVMGVIVQSVALDSAIGELPGVPDASAYNAIGRLTSNVEMGIVWHTAPVETLEDAKQKTVSVGATGAGSASSFVPHLLNDLVGTKFNVIDGYQGAADVALAMERGEVEGAMQGLPSLRTTRAQWLTEHKVRMIWQLALQPHPDYPDVPAVGQLGRTPEEQGVLHLVAGGADIGRSLVAPPGVPAERIAALRRAFDAMTADPGFRATATKRNQEIDPMSGKDLQALLIDAAATPKDVAEKARLLITGK